MGDDLKPSANERSHEVASASDELKVQLVAYGTVLLDLICVDCLRLLAV